MLFKRLNFEFLEQIQKDVLRVCKMPTYTGSIIYPCHGEKPTYGGMPSLIDEFKKLNLHTHNDIYGYNLSVVDPKQEIKIHNDFNPNITTLSINIPIVGYNNTYVKFYKQINDSNRIQYSNHTDFQTNAVDGWVYDPIDCELIDTFETNSPYLMDTRVPHSVHNHSDLTRLFLLVRIRSSSNEKLTRLS